MKKKLLIIEISDIKSILSQQKKINLLLFVHPILLLFARLLHFDQLKKINSLFKNKRILIEKPLFDKFKKLINNNKVFVGYNLRILKIVKFVKSFIRKIKIIYMIFILSIHFIYHTGENINYQNSIKCKKKIWRRSYFRL